MAAADADDDALLGLDAVEAAPETTAAQPPRARHWTLTSDAGQHARLVKFMLASYLILVSTHAFIRWHRSARRWERDPDYALADLHLVDLAPCALDAFQYFFVGRWHRRRGADGPAFLVPCLSGAFLFSAAGGFETLSHHSISLYSIRCEWPAGTALLAVTLVVLIVVLVALHVRQAWLDGVLRGRLLEIAALMIVFVLPRCRDPSFHLHHWFFSWLVGQCANQDPYWSVAASAFLWGGYLNGIAASRPAWLPRPRRCFRLPGLLLRRHQPTLRFPGVLPGGAPNPERHAACTCPLRRARLEALHRGGRRAVAAPGVASTRRAILVVP